MRSRARHFFWLGLALVLAMSIPAQQSQPTEYQIKSAFLFNFAKFIEWPSAALNGESSPIIIGILGENPFQDSLDRTIHGKAIDDHPLTIREFSSAKQATNCHILFVCKSEKARLREILETLKGSNVLTVSETDGFTETGGMINFIQQGSKLRFQINKDAAAKAGLKISSKLLSLAWSPES